MFPAYFAPRYFPDEYFPQGADVVVKPRYFLHSFFPARFYADRYFPGNVNVLEPEPEPTPTPVTGGFARPAPRRIPAIRGTVDLELPVLALDAVGFVFPADVTAVLDATLASLQLSATGQSVPSSVAGYVATTLATVGLVGLGTVQPTLTKPVRKRTRPDDDDELTEHYLVTLTRD